MQPSVAQRFPFAPLLALSVAFGACRSGSDAPPSFATAEVVRGDVAVTASADGVVEPIRTVEVKSKASGEIIAMNVDTGDRVAAGQVLLQLLPRDTQNAYDQAKADLDAAEARLDNAKLNLQRSQRLHDDGLIAAADLDAAELAVATTTSDVVRTRKALDTAAERLAETTVRSPIAGTVIGKSVEIGQVVSSAVSQVTGGTLLLTLADLSEVQVRSLVDEVDIGKVRVGLPVTIQVEAYPDRTFHGEVLKIEPQAVVDQNVTMFPVLTRIENREELLKPGMNAAIEVLIDHRDDVLTVPNEALKSPQEAMQLAALLGLGGGAGEAGPRRGRRSGGTAAATTGERRTTGQAPAASPSGDDGGGDGMGSARAGAGGEGENEVRVAFTSAPDGSLTPVRVRVGLRNWEVSEVVSGLTAGQRVALLPSAVQLRQSEEFRQRIERMRGMPGMSSSRSRQGNG